MQKFNRKLILIAIFSSFSVSASIAELPVVSTVVDYASVLKKDTLGIVSFTTKATRDTAVFTVAGLTLDAYVMSLPLDVGLKARIVSRISDPTYAIPLAYFLRTFYDRYTGVEDGDVFKQHLKTIYTQHDLQDMQHSLFSFDEPGLLVKDDPHNESALVINRELIAAMVVVYDELVDIDVWRKKGALPDEYAYVTGTDADIKTIGVIQPVLMSVLSKLSASMDEGDMKSAILHVLKDNHPDRIGVVNNQAQALTITIVDFVRLNTLKAYRQYLLNQDREKSLNQWMQNSLSDNPENLISFFNSQENRRLAVQITVDGLQQGLIEGLVDPNLPFMKKALSEHHKNNGFKPTDVSATVLPYEQNLTFLSRIANNGVDDERYLPFFSGLYHNHKNTVAQVGISSTPTISVRNLPIIKTGARVAGENGTGIPNFHFVDRKSDRAYYFFGNDALQLDKLTAERGMNTMFDRLNYLTTLNCNAQYDWNAHVSYDALVNLGIGEADRDFGEKRCLRELSNRASIEIDLRKKRKQLIKDIGRYMSLSWWQAISHIGLNRKIRQDLLDYSEHALNGMPDYVLVYNPWPDHFAHFKGPFSDEIISPTGELNRLDYWIGEMESVYRKSGVYDNTLWGMAGDHGLAPVHYAVDPQKAVLEPIEDKLGYELKIRKISSDEGEGPKITNAINSQSFRDTDIVIASTAGGNFMIDLFNSNNGWDAQPVYSELTDWKPVGKSGAGIDIISAFAEGLRSSLDYLVVRQGPCLSEQCEIRIVGTRDGKRHDEIISRKGSLVRYFSADDGEPVLLGINGTNDYLPSISNKMSLRKKVLLTDCVSEKWDVEKWCSSEQWRELSSMTPKPDSVMQLIALYEDDRAGTINLFPKDGVGYNTRVVGRHAGESYLEKDAFIGFWGKPTNGVKDRLPYAENGSLAPTIFEYLTGDKVIPNQDGWGYPSLLDVVTVK